MTPNLRAAGCIETDTQKSGGRSQRERKGERDEPGGSKKEKRLGKKCGNCLFDNYVGAHLFFKYNHELFSAGGGYPVCGKRHHNSESARNRKCGGCEDNPDCEFMSWQKPSKEKCPQCNSYLLEKGNKLVCADETCGYVAVKEPKE